MKIVIYGNNKESTKLLEMTNESLEGLGLSEFIEIENISDLDYKNKLSISKDFAFCIEEDSIDFKDIIFEGTIPKKEELDSLLLSIIGGQCSSGDSCGGSCSGCSGGCSC